MYPTCLSRTLLINLKLLGRPLIVKQHDKAIYRADSHMIGKQISVNVPVETWDQWEMFTYINIIKNNC